MRSFCTFDLEKQSAKIFMVHLDLYFSFSFCQFIFVLKPFNPWLFMNICTKKNDNEFQDRLLNDEMADLLHESMKILGIWLLSNPLLKQVT